ASHRARSRAQDEMLGLRDLRSDRFVKREHVRYCLSFDYCILQARTKSKEDTGTRQRVVEIPTDPDVRWTRFAGPSSLLDRCPGRPPGQNKTLCGAENE